MTELQKWVPQPKSRRRRSAHRGRKKRTALNAAAAALRARQAEILAANEEDLKAAKENGMSEAMLDRLALTLPALRAWQRVWKTYPPNATPWAAF